MLKTRRLFATIMVMVGVVVVISSFSLGKTFVSYDIGPDVYPRILGILIVILGLVMVLKPGNSNEAEKKIVIFDRKTLLYLCGMVAYTLIITPVGFILSSTLVMVPMIMIMGLKTPWKVASLSLGASLVLYLLFAKVLNVPLLKGILSIL